MIFQKKKIAKMMRVQKNASNLVLNKKLTTTMSNTTSKSMEIFFFGKITLEFMYVVLCTYFNVDTVALLYNRA